MVRMRLPDLRIGKLGFSSLIKSTEGWIEDSVSPERRTGRPDVVVSAGSNQFPAIVRVKSGVISRSIFK